jgi:hypothetical protein
MGPFSGLDVVAAIMPEAVASGKACGGAAVMPIARNQCVFRKAE